MLNGLPLISNKSMRSEGQFFFIQRLSSISFMFLTSWGLRNRLMLSVLPVSFSLYTIPLCLSSILPLLHWCYLVFLSEISFLHAPCSNIRNILLRTIAWRRLPYVTLPTERNAFLSTTPPFQGVLSLDHKNPRRFAPKPQVVQLSYSVVRRYCTSFGWVKAIYLQETLKRSMEW